jgi:hypothetical protein
MQQRQYMQMRAIPFVGYRGLNLYDSTLFTFSTWSQGATLIDSMPLSPPLSEKWTVIAWAFTFTGAIVKNSLSPAFGKLGALWAGLLTEGESPTGSSSQPWVNPMLPLPADLTNFQKVWDGGSDPVFRYGPLSASDPAPQQPSGGVSEVLPSPIEIDPGRPLAFGVWLTPSLVQDARLQIWNATASIIYDDGRPEGKTP